MGGRGTPAAMARVLRATARLRAPRPARRALCLAAGTAGGGHAAPGRPPCRLLAALAGPAGAARLRGRPQPAARRWVVAAAGPEGAEPGRVVFLGTPTFAAGVLERLLRGAAESAAAGEAGYAVVGVVSQPGAAKKKKKKKAKEASPGPVVEAALAGGVDPDAILTPASARDPEFLAAVAALRPDLCVTAAYGNFLPQAFLDLPKVSGREPSRIAKGTPTPTHAGD